MSEQRTPKILKSRLENQIGKTLEIDYHQFRGIENKGNICYIISLFQLFFHSPQILQYLKTVENLNDTEKMLSQIVNDLYTGHTKSISIQKFIDSWKGWGENNEKIPQGENQDVLEFFMYLTNKLSDDFKKFLHFLAQKKMILLTIIYFYVL